MKRWRTVRQCRDCPFNSSGPGLRLRRSLAPGRWQEILNSLKQDGSFPCHQTTRFDDEGEAHGGILCAGALAWQHRKNGQPGQLARVMERFAKR